MSYTNLTLNKLDRFRRLVEWEEGCSGKNSASLFSTSTANLRILD
jgi:hypothetical protein